MHQDIDLRPRAAQNLERHPHINQYLGEQLHRRLDASSDWLVNPLLHDLAMLPDQLNTERLLQLQLKQKSAAASMTSNAITITPTMQTSPARASP